MSTYTDRHAIQWLDSDQQASGVLLQAQRLIELEKSLRKVLPSALTHQLAVTRIDNGILEITAYNSAQTAKLRQLKKTICDCLLKDGWNVQEVKIRISASPAPDADRLERPREVQPLTAEDLNHFESLAATLRPGSQLADTVNALLRHHRTRK